MDEQFSRLAFLIGEEKVRYLQKCKVAVFGLGGVGGITAEALARSGVGHLVLVDSDTVSVSNLNRQILALHQNMGQKKIDVMKDRLLQINPGLKLTLFSCFYLSRRNAEQIIAFRSYFIRNRNSFQQTVFVRQTRRQAVSIRRIYKADVVPIHRLGAAERDNHW